MQANEFKDYVNKQTHGMSPQDIKQINDILFNGLKAPIFAVGTNMIWGVSSILKKFAK